MPVHRFGPGNSGRPKGSPNKTTKVFREAVLKAYEAIGGDVEFANWARANRTEYYKIAARLIPQELSVSGEIAPLIIDRVTETDLAEARERDAEKL